jgi:hypothetical protein
MEGKCSDATNGFRECARTFRPRGAGGRQLNCKSYCWDKCGLWMRRVFENPPTVIRFETRDFFVDFDIKSISFGLRVPAPPYYVWGQQHHHTVRLPVGAMPVAPFAWPRVTLWRGILLLHVGPLGVARTHVAYWSAECDQWYVKTPYNRLLLAKSAAPCPRKKRPRRCAAECARRVSTSSTRHFHGRGRGCALQHGAASPADCLVSRDARRRLATA